MKLSEKLLLEVDKFQVGDISRTGDSKLTVKDVDKERQSVTWDVQNDITNETIRKDLTGLISKFEKVLSKNSDNPQLSQLVKELRNIRNRFSRAMK